jgi:hypothetical protein
MAVSQEEAKSVVVGVVRLVAVHAMGASAVPRPSTHHLDEDALRAIERIVRDRCVGALATRVEKQASPGRTRTAENFTAAHLTYLRLHARLLQVFKSGAERALMMEALVEVLRCAGGSGNSEPSPSGKSEPRGRKERGR